MDFFDTNPTAAVAGGPCSPDRHLRLAQARPLPSSHVKNFRRALRQPGYNASKQIANGVERPGMGTSEAEMAETSVSILSWLVVAMVTYPHMMRKAQAMLDEVVGQQRLPVYEDRTRLPYIDAMIEEGDEYMGYRIPAGATVVASQRAITRDKGVFGADGDDSRPERWLEGQDLPRVSFGYARRLCPGRHVGRDGLWIMSARPLWAFEMEAPTDAATGEEGGD
ncbi:Fumitremorgin C synthase [Colletotrichum shisoi]|uniref:Fumitremorgin C synthase n=1 Tax=Colletotrichum shisoi TaxID=2078593 RepID=A0A5Q4BHV5_9PEZI|nr:Fumitremorgin C synthase [Colletotrichum shisoi]